MRLNTPLHCVWALSWVALVIGCGPADPPTSTTSTEGSGASEASEPADSPVEEPVEAVVEESDGRLGLDDSYEGPQRGTRVRMSYDAESNSFKGVVENMMRDSLSNVSVTVELSNGTELTHEIGDMESGSRKNVELKAEGGDFDRWSVTAGPEVAVAPPSASEESEG